MDDKSRTSFLKTRVSLIARLIDNRNDENSWNEFNKCYHDYIFALLKRMGLAHHDCEDLTQSTLITTWKKIELFDPNSEKGKFRSWLATMTRNIARNHFQKLRGTKSQTLTGQNQLYTGSLDKISEPEIDKIIEEEWEKYITSKAWKLIQPNLSEKVVSAFELSLSGKSISEIANEIGIEENTVYVYRQRVEKKLMQEIARLNYELS